MRAIILAGGKGTRLRPYTSLIPKPLVPLGGKYSILEIIILQLRNSGFTHITLAVNHLSHLIMAYFGDGARLGVRIDYSLEEGELSTIGPLTLIDDLPESFLVMNGDILCDLDYRAFYEAHLTADSVISVSAFQRRVKIDFGVLNYDASGRLESFKEKPEYDFDVSMGIYCINRSVIEELPREKKYGFDNLMLDSLAANRRVEICPFNGYWLDIGRPDDYEYADENFNELTQRLGIE
ncbi:sugar phosphate nucleotidyltransferase [Polynucleobacter sp. AP-Sanab-80-C2]|uniref:sugar phosphate nucleotidyltransferase n=1 Tax=Polynucleobacter sp. AP-Sanab-80-C2 TaxID=3108274 RepID=UPI002B22A98C|nr:sugar phosphate nucleotidyltransferase [Polynucleobacter sp. AP-Sanab-80-C2]MEA9598528.1 sugar phosphate nucleotidyltransferase [Polynucleobacter sp. AP-Sanab-80-C2]